MVASPHQAVGETIIARPRLFGLGRPRPAAATVKASGEPARLLLDDFLQRQPLLAAINGLIAALTALALAGTAPPGVLLVWLLAMLVAQASRLALWLAVRFHPALTAQRLAELLTLASALTGAGLGLGRRRADTATTRRPPPSWCRSCWPACRRARSPPCRRIPRPSSSSSGRRSCPMPCSWARARTRMSQRDGRHHPALRRGLVRWSAGRSTAPCGARRSSTCRTPRWCIGWTMPGRGWRPPSRPGRWSCERPTPRCCARSRSGAGRRIASATCSPTTR